MRRPCWPSGRGRTLAASRRSHCHSVNRETALTFPPLRAQPVSPERRRNLAPVVFWVIAGIATTASADLRIAPNPASRALPVVSLLHEGRYEITTFQDMTLDMSQIGDRYFSDKAPGGTWWVIPAAYVWDAVSTKDADLSRTTPGPTSGTSWRPRSASARGSSRNAPGRGRSAPPWGSRSSPSIRWRSAPYSSSRAGGAAIATRRGARGADDRRGRAPSYWPARACARRN